MEVWKMIFHLKWVTFSNLSGVYTPVKEEIVGWKIPVLRYLPEESFGYVWSVYPPDEI